MALMKDYIEEINEAVLAAIPDPFFVFDNNGRYLQILGGTNRKKYQDAQHLIGKRIHDIMPEKLADRFLSEIKRAIGEGKVITCVYSLSALNLKGSANLEGPSGEQWFEANISPIKKIDGQPPMVVWAAFNITRLHNAITQKDQLISELKNAANEIKTLREILPICSFCKRIRDDKGYWNQVEAYIHEHTGVEFSHGICSECAEKYYGKIITEPEREN